MESYYMEGLLYKRALAEGETKYQADFDRCKQYVEDYIRTAQLEDLKTLPQNDYDRLTESFTIPYK